MTLGPPLPEVALEIDCRGRRCPLPIIELARHLDEVAIGEVIVVVADDHAARVDVPAWCRLREQDYLGDSIASDGVPTYWVRRTG